MSSKVKDPISRRRFLRGMVAASSGAVWSTCCGLLCLGSRQPFLDPTATPEPTEPPRPVEKPRATATSPPPPTPAATAPPTETSIPKSTLLVMGLPSYLTDDERADFLSQSTHVSNIEYIEREQDRLMAMLAAGDPPDMWQASIDYLGRHILLDQLLDLTDYFDASDVLVESDMLPAVGYFQFDSGWYGMPTQCSPEMLVIINQQLFEEAGIEPPQERTTYTYQDAAEWARTFSDRLGDRDQFVGWGDNGWWHAILQHVMVETEDTLYSEDLQRARIAENETVRDVLSFYAQLAEEDLIWHPLNPSPTWPGFSLLDGNTPFTRYGYWYHGLVLTRESEELAAPEEAYQLRSGLSWGGETAANPSMGSSGWVISNITEAPEAAWELFEYTIGGPPAKRQIEEGWIVPPLKSLLPHIPQETAFDRQWYDSVLWELENTIQSPHRLSPYLRASDFDELWNEHLGAYLLGDISLEQAIEVLDIEANELLEKNKDDL